MQVSEIMSTKLDTIAPAETLVHAARIMRDDDIGSLPVVENDRILGVITDRDIAVRAVAEGRDVNSTAVRDAMSTDPVYCSPEHSLEDASRKMAQAMVRRLPVVEGDRLIGIVSLGDLARHEPAPESGEALKDVSKPTDRPRAI